MASMAASCARTAASTVSKVPSQSLQPRRPGTPTSHTHRSALPRRRTPRNTGCRVSRNLVRPRRRIPRACRGPHLLHHPQRAAAGAPPLPWRDSLRVRFDAAEAPDLSCLPAAVRDVLQEYQRSLMEFWLGIESLRHGLLLGVVAGVEAAGVDRVGAADHAFLRSRMKQAMVLLPCKTRPERSQADRNQK